MNWQPPPGEPQARQPISAACWRLISSRAKRAARVCTFAVSSASSASRLTPPGTSTEGKSKLPARAMSIAGSPLSHVAMPSTPRRVGSERMRRRNTMAASLRYGRLSSMPAVPLVRPSQGSLT